jgi:beta-N-acetylhexosaminidase
LRSLRAVALIGAVLVPATAVAGPAAAHTDAWLPPTAVTVAASAYAHMTPAERIGQLFMAGVPSSGASKAAVRLLARHDVGDVILDHNTAKSLARIHRGTRQLVRRLRTAGVAPFISTDQEGGAVQRLTGPGFATIPAALRQGRLHRHVLRSAARGWANQLTRAGVTLDLAPVADTVPAGHAHANQPIGRFDREYGHTPKRVAAHVVAFIRGARSAGLATSLKHFPGLGRASGNTDLLAHVTDPTTRHDAYLAPFRDGIKAGVPFVMVSSATYPSIDGSQPACFSRVIMTSMLRRHLHFSGVVISDDLGTAALSRVPLAKRATRFFAAGGTMALDTSAAQLPAMIRAVKAKVTASPGFADTIKAAVLTNLAAKASAGLVAGETVR